MKKFLFILTCALVTAIGASAQQKGDVYVGGDFGIGINATSVSIKDYGSTDSATTVDFTIQPKVGVFVADRFMLGFGLGYNIMGGDGSTTHTLAVGPTLSYYVSLCKNLYYTPSLDLAFCYAASEGVGFPGFGFGLTVFGMEYRPTQKIGISGSLLSLNYVLLSKEGINVHNVEFGLTINPTIGIKYYF